MQVATCEYEVVLHVPLDDVLVAGTLCAQDVPIGVMKEPHYRLCAGDRRVDNQPFVVCRRPASLCSSEACLVIPIDLHKVPKIQIQINRPRCGC